jgi:hypothetical protein
MEHFSTEGFTSLSPEELLTVDGGGLLTDLTGKLTTQLAEVVEVAKDITAATGAFLKTIVGIIV